MSESSSERVIGTLSQLARCVAFRWEPQRTDLGNLNDMPDDQMVQAGNGTGELGAWVAVAASMRGRLFTTLSYEPIYEWINGMGVVMYDDELRSTA